MCSRGYVSWVSIADSDLYNWISAINEVKEFKDQVTYDLKFTLWQFKDQNHESLMTKIFSIKNPELKFFNFKEFDRLIMIVYLFLKQVLASSQGFEVTCIKSRYRNFFMGLDNGTR